MKKTILIAVAWGALFNSQVSAARCPPDVAVDLISAYSHTVCINTVATNKFEEYDEALIEAGVIHRPNKFDLRQGQGVYDVDTELERVRQAITSALNSCGLSSYISHLDTANYCR